MSKTVAIIEARMASTRLPGKVMLPLDEKPAIQLVIERLQNSKKIDEICVATTRNSYDDALVSLVENIGISVHRGSDWNVLERVINAALEHQADIIVEITADCPFVDFELVDYMIDLLQINNIEYIANNFETSFADGFDVQVYYLETLIKMSHMKLSKKDREHVTMKIRQNPKLFRTFNLLAPENLRRPHYSVTLDTIEDYEAIKLIYKTMKKREPKNFGVTEITRYLDQHPEIVSINQNIPRKGYE